VPLKDVEVSSLDPGRFEAVLDPDSCRRFLDRLAKAADRLAGRRLWQVSSTEQGGGVAEMLHFLLGYLTGAGRRCCIRCDPFEQGDCRHENPPPVCCSGPAVRLRRLPLPA
jgi:hypothetical protein